MQNQLNPNKINIPSINNILWLVVVTLIATIIRNTNCASNKIIENTRLTKILAQKSIKIYFK